MDSALKQRLLGAAVLIALAVIFVPMLFTGSAPKQESATLNLEIPPAPDREFDTRVLPVEPSRSSSVPATVSEPVVPVDVTTAPPTSALATPAEPEPAPATVPAAVEPKPAPTPTATPEPPAPGTAANGRFLVHLGVYTSTKNADDLVAALKRGGYSAFSEATEFQGRSAQRVRVGPYADRAAAEAARIRIKQIKPDVPGSVVAIAESATADAPREAVPANRAGGWAVQLGAFKTVEEANKLKGRLQAAGFVSYVDKLATEDQTLWRVRAGPETDRAAADKLRGRIKDKLKLDGLVVTQ